VTDRYSTVDIDIVHHWSLFMGFGLALKNTPRSYTTINRATNSQQKYLVTNRDFIAQVIHTVIGYILLLLCHPHRDGRSRHVTTGRSRDDCNQSSVGESKSH